MICKNCGKKICENDIGVAETGAMLYNIEIDSRGSLIWERKDFEEDEGDMIIYHQTCLGKIADYDEDLLKKIIGEGK